MLLIASENIKDKIEEFHGISFLEAEEAFNNFVGHPLVDDRARHKTKPETVWCLSETYDGRLLKLVYNHTLKGSYQFCAQHMNQKITR